MAAAEDSFGNNLGAAGAAGTTDADVEASVWVFCLFDDLVAMSCTGRRSMNKFGM